MKGYDIMQILPTHDHSIEVRSTVDIVTARQKGRELALEMKFCGSDVTLIAAAVSEVARYLLDHAEKGEITFSFVQKKGQHGLQVLADDQGTAVPDTRLATQNDSVPQTSAIGLEDLKCLMDDFELDSGTGEGTRILMRKWSRSKRPHFSPSH